MGFWDAVVLMFLIGAFAFVRSQRCRSGAADEHERIDTRPERRENELESEITELRKRIAVLERIATDERKSRDIAAEIEALRDRPPLEDRVKGVN